MNRKGLLETQSQSIKREFTPNRMLSHHPLELLEKRTSKEVIEEFGNKFDKEWRPL